MPDLNDIVEDKVDRRKPAFKGQRIYLGNPTKRPLPYQLSLVYEKGSYSQHTCGAVLISPGFVLTARHCVYNVSAENGFLPLEKWKRIPVKYFKLFTEAHKIKYEGNLLRYENSQMRLIKKVIPFFTDLNKKVDLVMIELTEPFKLNDKVMPACLPNRPVEPMTKCIASGWGITYEEAELGMNERKNLTLQVADLYVSKLRCNPHEICTESPDMKSACSGDSGGPLICPGSGGAAIYGIASYVSEYCDTGVKPRRTTYVNVFYFKDQIKRILNLAEDNPCPVNKVGYGDGTCEGILNNSFNCFDGGDCCKSNQTTFYCKLFCRDESKCNCDCI